MTCSACPFIVKKSLLKAESVTEVSVDIDLKIASVTFDDVQSAIILLTTATANADYPSVLKE